MDDTNQSRTQSSRGCQTLHYSDSQGRLNQTATSSESISELSKTLESSLYVSKNPGSRSTDGELKEQYNVSKSSDFKENESEKLSIREEIESSSRDETPESAIIVRNKSPIKNVIPTQKRTKRIWTNHSPYHQALPSTSVKNSTGKNRFAEHHAMKSCHSQVPPTNIMTAEKSLFLSSSGTKTSYCNPMLPIRTNMTPMQKNRNYSYPNSMPFVKTNAAPVRHAQNSSYYKSSMPPIQKDVFPIRCDQLSSQNQNIPDRMDATSMTQIQSTRDASSNESAGNNYSLIGAQGLDLTPGQIFKLPEEQIQNPPSKEIEKQNTSDPKLEESKKVTKLSELAKQAHDSKKNLLKIDVYEKVLPTSYFPVSATSTGGLLMRQIQNTPIQFPPPCGGGYFESALAACKAIPNIPCQTVKSYPQSRFFPLFNQIVPNQSVSRPHIQSNIPIDLSNAGNAIQPPIQVPIMMPQSGQCQQAIQNSTSAPQYENPINPPYQYGMQYEYTLPILNADFRYQNPNCHQCQYPQSANSQYPNPNYYIYQSGIQYQSNMQNPTSNFQHQDPNRHLHQSGIQYQSNMQNLNSNFQYQDPNHTTYVFPETFGPPNILLPFTTCDANVPFQQLNSNMLPMQTFTTNSSSTEIIPNLTWPYGSTGPSDLNSLPYNTGMQATVGIPSSINSGQFPSCSYATNASTNTFLNDPSQGSNSYGCNSICSSEQMQINMYTPWSVSTDDSPKATLTCGKDEALENK